MARQNYITALRSTYLFASMSEEHIQLLLRDARDIHLQPGEGLFSHGTPAEHFYFVHSGLIKLFRLSREGGEKIIEILRPGETFAEAVAFMGNQARYPVSAEAMSETHLIAFSQKTFLELLRGSPEACFGMLSSMSRRLHMLVNQIDGLTLQNATYRLVAYLLDQIPLGARVSPDIQLTTPKNAIASHLAIQPETLSRILSRLRQDNLIDIEGAHITIRNIEALRKLVHSPSN